MPDSFRSSRKVALEKGVNRSGLQTPEIPEENKPGQYVDAAAAAQPKSFGGQSSPAEPSPFNLRGKS